MTDPIERAAELDRQILAIPADQVFTKRTVTRIAAVVIALLMVLVVMTFNVTRSTGSAVRHEIPGLKAQIVARDKTIAEQQDVLTQATDAIVMLCHLLEAHQVKCPEIVLRPKDKS